MADSCKNTSRNVGFCRVRRRRYYLGLGGNMGNPGTNLARAVRLLEEQGVRVLEKSSLYRTEPVGLSKQPWFVNQAIAVQTDLTPHELLRLVKSVESTLGRRPGPRNGPRPIDIDILLADGVILKTPELEIPHPRLAERAFVLVPLAEIAPRAVHPILGKTIRRLLRECPDFSIVELMR